MTESAKVIGFLPHLADPVCWKIPYDTARQAYAVIDLAKNKRNRHERRIYKCDVCNKFHTTSQRYR